MAVKYRGGDVLNFRGDLVALCHFSDTRPLAGSVARFDWRFNAGLSHLWRGKPELLDYGVLTLVPTSGRLSPGRVFLMGLGKEDELSRDLRRDVYRRIFAAAMKLGAEKVAAEGIAVDGIEDNSILEDVQTAVEDQNAGSLEVSIYLRERSVLETARDLASR